MGLASTKVPICSNKAALVVMENRLPNFISRRQRIRNEGKGKGGKGKEERKEECGSGSKKRCSWFYLTCATIKNMYYTTTTNTEIVLDLPKLIQQQNRQSLHFQTRFLMHHHLLYNGYSLMMNILLVYYSL